MRVLAVSTAFSHSDMSGTEPCPSRSSGTKHMPSARRADGAAPADGHAVELDGVGASPASRSPISASISSDCPLPATPAMPRISPPLTSRLTSSRSTPNCSALASVRPPTFSRTGPMRSGLAPGRDRGWRRSSSRPGCARSPAAGRSGRPPCRRAGWWRGRTARGSPPACGRCRGSSSPPTTSRRRVANSTSISCGVSTEVGSSMMSSFGSCSRQRTISTRWRSPTDRLPTRRSGSSFRP